MQRLMQPGRRHRVLAPVLRIHLLPLALRRRPVKRHHIFINAVRYVEFDLRVKAKRLFGQPDLILTQGRAVGRRGIFLVRAAEADLGAASDDGWPRALRLGDLNGGANGSRIMAVN